MSKSVNHSLNWFIQNTDSDTPTVYYCFWDTQLFFSDFVWNHFHWQSKNVQTETGNIVSSVRNC